MEYKVTIICWFDVKHLTVGVRWIIIRLKAEKNQLMDDRIFFILCEETTKFTDQNICNLNVQETN